MTVSGHIVRSSPPVALSRIFKPALIVAWLVSAPAAAQTGGDAGNRDTRSASGGQSVSEHVDEFLGRIERLLESIPKYELPQINENGDIIIRRIRPRPEGELPPTYQTRGTEALRL